MTTIQAVQRLRDVARRQHKALATEHTYLYWLRRYMAVVQRMPTTLPSERKRERFLTALAHDQVAASTQNQAFNAIAFFYKDVLGTPLQGVEALRVTRPAHLRHAPTVTETRTLLQAVRDVGGYLHADSLSVVSPLARRERGESFACQAAVRRRARGDAPQPFV